MREWTRGSRRVDGGPSRAAPARSRGRCSRWLLGLALLATPASCRRGASPATRSTQSASEAQGESAPSVQFEVRAESTDLTFLWFDAEGNAHAVSHLQDVPADRRVTVRVDPSRPELRAPGWVYVADLRQAGADGRYTVRALTAEQFARALEQARGNTARAPEPAPAPAMPPGVSPVLQPSAPMPGLARAGRVVIYGASWCGACHQAAAYLRSQNIPFVERDIEREPEAAQEMAALARAQGVPTGSIPIINVGGRLLVGFDPGALQQALRGT